MFFYMEVFDLFGYAIKLVTFYSCGIQA